MRKSLVGGIPHIPGVKRYLDHRILHDPDDTDAASGSRYTTSIPLVKRLLKGILRNSILKSCAVFLNRKLRLGDTVTMYAEKDADCRQSEKTAGTSPCV